MVTTPIGAGRAQAFDVLVRPNGRIVAGGVASLDMADPGSFALAGYKPNGQPDPAFGTGGQAQLRVGDGFDAISDLVMGPDENVIAVGHAQLGGHDGFALASFDEQGEPDAAFGTGGSLIVPTSAPYAYAAAGALLRDGRVVAVGASGKSSAVETSASAVSRSCQRHCGGAVAPAGRRLLLLRQRRRRPRRRARPVGRGGDRRHGYPGMGLARTSPDGAPTRRSAAPDPCSSRARDGSAAADVVLEPGGRAVAAGDSSAGPSTLSRSPASTAQAGSIAASAAGRRAHRLPGHQVARATALAIQADGKLVAAGIACASGSGAQCSGGTSRLALARYLGGAATRRAARARASGTQPAGRREERVRLAARRGCAARRRREGARSLPAGRSAAGAGSRLRRLRKGRSPLLLGARSVSVPGTAPAASA